MYATRFIAVLAVLLMARLILVISKINKFTIAFQTLLISGFKGDTVGNVALRDNQTKECPRCQ